MENINIEDIKKIMCIISDIIIENEKKLSELDGVIGDGDFGYTISKGFKAIKDKINKNDEDDTSKLMKSFGMIMMKNCGGASGPLWGTGFINVSDFTQGKEVFNLKDISGMIGSFIQGVKKIGKADLGDKTFLDALIPAYNSMKNDVEQGEVNIVRSINKASKEAEIGAEKTKEMVAKKGRATYLGDRSLGHVDAGAYAIALLFKEITDKLPSEN
ncbi:MAG: dihydroxyacetone kinase subunit L [Tissierellales bacterium]|nr:dihydroxyacetone kinase subunit L [Tissierellales bacterium]